MKIFVTFCTILFFVKSKELRREDRYQIALECIDEVDIDRKIIENAMAEQTVPKHDTKYREFLSCSYKKQGYQNQNGEILIENIKKFLGKVGYNPPDLERLNVCNKDQGENHGENAVNAVECIIDKLKNVTFTELN